METIGQVLLGIVVFAIVFFVILKKISKGETEGGTKILKEYVPALILYGLGLVLMNMTCQSFWKAWTNPFWIFLITNAIVMMVAIFYKQSLWLVVIIMAIFIFCNYEPTNVAPKLNTNSSEQQKPALDKEADMLVQEGYTPLTVDINYKFQFRTEGKPINVKFNGIREVVSYSGEGSFKAPLNMLAGETVITSGDTLNPRIWVKVYKIIKI